MRPRLRLHIVVARLALFAALLILAPANHLSAQRLTPLPRSWTDAVSQLADKIAATISPSTPIVLNMENISSLDASYAGYLQLSLTEELRRHSFQFGSSDNASSKPAVQIQLKLSESADAYIWIVEISKDSPDQNSAAPIIVSVLKSGAASTGSGAQSLSLETRLVFHQSQKFLDFAVINDAVANAPRLLILSPNEISIYESADGQWKLSHATPVPQAVPPRRAPGGTINVKEGYLFIAGSKCAGRPDLAGDLNCVALKPGRYLIGPKIDVPGLPRSLGVFISGSCRGEMISLFTGDSDWTEPDSIQGYLEKSAPLPVVPSGGAVRFDGPVVSFTADVDSTEARAIVHNLKTGDYEAYIVTATCNH